MIEAVMLWNEPNNLSHWDFELDPDWRLFAGLVREAASAIRSEHRSLPIVLGGISPIDPAFIRRLDEYGALEQLDAIAVHGFPLDWNHWTIDEWPDKLAEVAAVTSLPIWISEVGVSTFGADEVQVFGLERSAQLLAGRAPRIHWYSLFDLPRTWPATTRHREAEGSAYYRHFHMGLVRENGQPKPAARAFGRYTPAFGVCQWFHFDDPRLDCGVRWLDRLGVRYVRTGLSWADSVRPGADAWLDRLVSALDPFDVTATFCFTPEQCGLRPHHTSPPREPKAFADFCATMVRRYAV